MSKQLFVSLRHRLALLADQHAAALHAHLHIHQKLCSHGTAAQPQAQQRGHQALHQRSILVRKG